MEGNRRRDKRAAAIQDVQVWRAGAVLCSLPTMRVAELEKALSQIKSLRVPSQNEVPYLDQIARTNGAFGAAQQIARAALSAGAGEEK